MTISSSLSSAPLSGPNDPRVRHQSVTTNGVVLHVAQAGPEDGPLLILLHGFPAFWYDWRYQIPALAEAGYRIWAPDQRGYNSSDKPAPVRAYNLNTLADDVAGLIDAAAEDKALVVGHDWGAGVTWWLAQRHPQRLRAVAMLNTPHPWLLGRKIRTSLRQFRRSLYVFYFQLPWHPEFALTSRNFGALADTIRRTARPGVFTAEELAHYRETWSQPGAMKAMLNWYRAAARFLPRVQAWRVRVPTLVIWGRRDFALESQLAEESVALCEDGRLFWVEQAGHWVHLEEPALVNRVLLDFLAQAPGADSTTSTPAAPA